MEAKLKIRNDAQPEQRRTDKVDALLQDIADDARRRSDRYAKETVVPEGGE